MLFISIGSFIGLYVVILIFKFGYTKITNKTIGVKVLQNTLILAIVFFVFNSFRGYFSLIIDFNRLIQIFLVIAFTIFIAVQMATYKQSDSIKSIYRIIYYLIIVIVYFEILWSLLVCYSTH